MSLHYIDDTLLFVAGDAGSLISLNLILYAFEMMTDLKFNFHKSYVYNMSRCDEVAQESLLFSIVTSALWLLFTLDYLSK